MYGEYLWDFSTRAQAPLVEMTQWGLSSNPSTCLCCSFYTPSSEGAVLALFVISTKRSAWRDLPRIQIATLNLWQSWGRTSFDRQWRKSRKRCGQPKRASCLGSERPEKEPVALSQRRTGGSPGKAVATIEVAEGTPREGDLRCRPAYGCTKLMSGLPASTPHSTALFQWPDVVCPATLRPSANAVRTSSVSSSFSVVRTRALGNSHSNSEL